MPAGRPTEYRPEYGEDLIALMATGLSLSASAAALGFHRQRVYEWAKKYPELADNINVARGKRLLHLEKRLLSDATPGPAMTGTIFALKNADAEEWREKVVNEHTGKDGGPIEVSARDRISSRIAGIAARKREGRNPPDADGG